MVCYSKACGAHPRWLPYHTIPSQVASSRVIKSKLCDFLPLPTTALPNQRLKTEHTKLESQWVRKNLHLENSANSKIGQKFKHGCSPRTPCDIRCWTLWRLRECFFAWSPPKVLNSMLPIIHQQPVWEVRKFVHFDALCWRVVARHVPRQRQWRPPAAISKPFPTRYDPKPSQRLSLLPWLKKGNLKVLFSGWRPSDIGWAFTFRLY